MSKASGFVVRVFSTGGKSAKGPWAADSLKIQDSDGTEDPYFYRLGFRDKGKLDVAPPLAEGDYVSFDYEDNDDTSRNVVKGSLKKPAKAPAAPPAKATSSGGSTGGGGSSERQEAIHFQNSRTAAIAVVGILLENKGLPVSGKSTKAGEAERFDQIIEAIDSLTVKYFKDAEDHSRLLDVYADVGERDLGARGELPEEVAVPEEGEADEAEDEPVVW